MYFNSQSVSKCDKYPREAEKTILYVVIRIQAYKICRFVITYFFIRIFVLTRYNCREILHSARHSTVTEQKHDTFGSCVHIYVYFNAYTLLYISVKKSCMYRGIQRRKMRKSCRCLGGILTPAKGKVCSVSCFSRNKRSCIEQ